FGSNVSNVQLDLMAGANPNNVAGVRFYENGVWKGGMFRNSEGAFVQENGFYWIDMNGTTTGAVSPGIFDFAPVPSSPTSRISIGRHPSNVGPVVVQSGWGGDTYNLALFAYNWGSPDGSSTTRINAGVGGSAISMREDDIQFHIINTANQVRTPLRIYNLDVYVPGTTSLRFGAYGATVGGLGNNGQGEVGLNANTALRISSPTVYVQQSAGAQNGIIYFGPNGSFPSIQALSASALRITVPGTRT